MLMQSSQKHLIYWSAVYVLNPHVICTCRFMPSIINYCQSPTPATRDSTWRDDGVGQWDSLSVFYGLPVYSKFKILFYTFTKTLGQRFDIFSSPSPRLIISINHWCSSESLLQWFSQYNTIYYLPLLMCPIVNLWLHCNSCYIPSVYYLSSWILFACNILSSLSL